MGSEVGLKWRERASSLYNNHPFSQWHPKCQKVFQEIQSKELTVAVACSGGADSIFTLLTIHHFLKGRVYCIHVDHGTRGDTSSLDANFVLEVCGELGCPIKICRLPKSDKSGEGDLRESRLTEFRNEMNNNGITTMVQGHQLDDVAESFLWRISRGAGPEGLCSPRPVQKYDTFTILRPFVNLSRQQIRTLLETTGTPWREDETNDTPVYLRNRLRLKVVNQWKKNVDRDLLTGVEISRNLIEEQNEAIEQWVKEVFKDACEGTHLKVNLLRALPSAIQRGVLQFWLSKIGAKPSNVLINQVITSILNKESSWFSVSNSCRLYLTNDKIELVRDTHYEKKLFSYEVASNSSIYFHDGSSIKITTSGIKGYKGFSEIDPDRECVISIDDFDSSIIVIRNRELGERYQKLGSSGTKKVSKLMIDQKIPTNQRDKIPVFSNTEDQLLWIPGFPPSDKFKITKSTKRVMHLTYESVPT